MSELKTKVMEEALCSKYFLLIRSVTEYMKCKYRT